MLPLQGALVAVYLFGSAPWRPVVPIAQSGRGSISARNAHSVVFDLKVVDRTGQSEYQIANKATKGNYYSKHSSAGASLAVSAPTGQQSPFFLAHHAFPSALVDYTFSPRGPPSVSLQARP